MSDKSDDSNDILHQCIHSHAPSIWAEGKFWEFLHSHVLVDICLHCLFLNAPRSWNLSSDKMQKLKHSDVCNSKKWRNWQFQTNCRRCNKFADVFDYADFLLRSTPQTTTWIMKTVENSSVTPWLLCICWDTFKIASEQTRSNSQWTYRFTNSRLGNTIST